MGELIKKPERKVNPRIWGALAIVLSAPVLFGICYLITPRFSPLSIPFYFLVIYCIAKCLREEKRIKVVVNKFDKWLVIISSLCLTVGGLAWGIFPDHKFGMITTLIGIPIIIYSFYLTIMLNKHDPVRLVIAVIAKFTITVGICLIIIFFVLIIIRFFADRDSDNKEDKFNSRGEKAINFGNDLFMMD